MYWYRGGDDFSTYPDVSPFTTGLRDYVGCPFIKFPGFMRFLSNAPYHNQFYCDVNFSY
jgi:hypothetical protein